MLLCKYTLLSCKYSLMASPIESSSMLLCKYMLLARNSGQICKKMGSNILLVSR
jgi:hypothetical protein